MKSERDMYKKSVCDSMRGSEFDVPDVRSGNDGGIDERPAGGIAAIRDRGIQNEVQ